MLIDSTLREGEQSFGTYMSLHAKKYILKELAAIGVEEVEIGCLGQDDLQNLLALAKEVAPEMKHTVWCRCLEADIRKAASLHIDRIHLGVPVSELHLKNRLGMSTYKLLTLMERVIRTARESGITYISIGLEDCSRASLSFAKIVARHAETHGVQRVRLSDTVGLWTPADVSEWVSAISKYVSIPVGVHCHNDLGMATANAITAIQTGASFTDVSVLGLGERAGISSLEEVATALVISKGKQYDLNQLRNLSAYVSRMADIDIARNKAVVGKDIFAVESGLHVDGMKKDPLLFEPFAPESVGHTRRFSIGKKAGKAAITHKAETLGLTSPKQTQANKSVDEHVVPELVRSMRIAASKLGRPLTDEEFQSLWSKEMPHGAETHYAHA